MSVFEKIIYSIWKNPSSATKKEFEALVKLLETGDAAKIRAAILSDSGGIAAQLVELPEGLRNMPKKAENMDAPAFMRDAELVDRAKNAIKSIIRDLDGNAPEVLGSEMGKRFGEKDCLKKFLFNLGQLLH